MTNWNCIWEKCDLVIIPRFLRSVLVKLIAWQGIMIWLTQTPHIKNGICTLKNQYFNSQNSNQVAMEPLSNAFGSLWTKLDVNSSSCWQQTVIDWNKRVSVGPSKGQHAVTALEFHRAVVKDFRQKFCFPWTGTVKETVIYNEYILAVFICKGLHEDIDDSGGKQCCKTKSVDLWIIEETVNCVFTERAVKYTCFPLHIHTSIRKSEAEQISKHFD